MGTQIKQYPQQGQIQGWFVALSLDRASTSLLSTPLMWDACMWKSNFAVMKAKHLAKCIVS